MDHCHCCSSAFQQVSRRTVLKRAMGLAATALAANMFPLEMLFQESGACGEQCRQDAGGRLSTRRQ